MVKDDERKKVPDITDLFSLKIFGIDFGEMLKSWLGVADLTALQDPAQVEEVKKRIEEQREKLKEAQEQFRKKYGDAIRFDYDIRVRSLLGGEGEFRIGGGEFFERLDELAKERAQWKTRLKSPRRTVPYERSDEVREPLVDIIEDNEYVEVVADMPGVDEKSIELKFDEDKVALSTEASERKYRAEIALPAKVSPQPVEQTYNNGVLRVKLKKQLL